MSLPLKLNRPIIFFDLETTGLDFKYDRVIEIAAIKIHPDGKEETYHKRLNPGIRIPVEVTTITGIRNQDVADCRPFSAVIDEIELFFENSDLGGYNVIRFDAKVMQEEFKRCNRDFNLEERDIVDSKIIYHLKEKRDLSAAYKFYCSKDLVDAHSALADTKATYEIWLSQMDRYPDLPKSVKELFTFCRSEKDRFVDSDGKFFWRDGEAVFNFGKHKSKSLKDVVKKDPEYLDWIIAPERNFSQDVVDICYNAMRGKFPSRNTET